MTDILLVNVNGRWTLQQISPQLDVPKLTLSVNSNVKALALLAMVDSRTFQVSGARI